MSIQKHLTKREAWLIWRLIESLRQRGIPFEGKDGEFAGDFDRLRYRCIDQGFDYDPKKG